MWNSDGQDLGRYQDRNMDAKNLHFLKTSYLFQFSFFWSNLSQWRQVKSDCRISYSFRFFPRCSKSNNLEMTVLLSKAWIQGCSPPRIPGTTRIITFFWVWDPYKPLFQSISLLRGGGEHPQSMAPMPPWPHEVSPPYRCLSICTYHDLRNRRRQ